ncbi:amidohydrolase family protein [Actinomadura algeriensis]|uniref:Microsomal dipeptidase-like Zn-dependent dipeptidase n=1 Tax=Actinomadura algeriensis TaxID=1679523 RepID=A0ABR9JKR2_9ACTN|nr:Coagulation factor 5/8 type domain-containing protein [Actinomadura algeriensis]MBE1530715.1 microsomal dipeptidase-like Zn-dependent dipeptidase [Actinomadura algeriensis]
MPIPRPLRRLTTALTVAALLAALLAAWPTPSANAAPAAPPAPRGEVRGYVDLHSHLMSYEAFGGSLLCGKPFDPDGIGAALSDCPDHGANGAFAWFENFTRHGSPFGTHDPTGWPTFTDWPAWDSRTHQQVYYTWLERSWRAGQRVLVNQLVANRQLCEVYPLKRNACDEMDVVRLQAQRTREMEAYIDERNGGPGEGWFRIVTGPAEARRVIESGRLAVVLGVETSEPFGCRTADGKPLCTRDDIDRGLDEMQDLGVSSMFLCHKFDNALCGVRFDPGTTGLVINAGNFLGTGRFWQAETCTGAAHDNTIAPAGGLGDALREPLRHLGMAGITLPLYPSPPHCNVRGLTDLGAHMVEGMIDRGMIVEIDHMSVKAADETLSLLEDAGHSGVVSSHSWTDGNFVRRVYRLGGMVTGYGSPADGFVREWAANKRYRDPRHTFGYGYGLDANGMGPLPAPRADNDANPLEYPFTSPFDPSVELNRLRTGRRTWDLNTEGVANYGLVPDWLADVGGVGGPEIIADLTRGAESYLQMWTRTRNGPNPA